MMNRLKQLIAVLTFLVVLGVGSAVAQRPMTPEDILALKQVSDPQVSPDGRWIAYVVSQTELEQNTINTDVWLVATAGGEPVRLTTSPRADGSPRWSPDSKWIAFISAREERPQIWLIRPNGGEAEKLTSSKSGVQSLVWSPDGKTIAYTALREWTAEEEKKQKDRDDAIVVDQDHRFGRIWTIDVATKKAAEVVAGDFHPSNPQWSPDGTQLAYEVRPTPAADDGARSDVYIITLASKEKRKLFENPGIDNNPRWSPDGRWIAFSSRPDGFGQTELKVIPAAGGTPRTVATRFLYQPGAATWSADGRTLFFTASVRTTNQLFSVPVAGGEPKQLTSHNGTMSGATMSDDGRTIAFTVSDVTRPNDVYVVRDPARFAPVKLTDHNPQLAEIALGRGELYRWKSKDGMEIEGVLIYPPDYDPSKRYPTMAFIHGGPSGVWTQGFPGSSGNYGHIWAGRGWVSFYPNVRGSSGYGDAFMKANVRDWGGGDYQDIQTGLDELVRRGVADPDRLGQSGWSYGGYMTAWTLTQTDRFKALMVGAGLTNMYSMYSTNDLQTTLENYFGAEPWDDEEAYRRASAMVYIKQAKTPTLILHGQQDLRVPIGQAQELYMGLKKNGVPVELVFYPRAGHGLSEPRHQLDRMRREYAFFSKRVLGVDVSDKPALIP